MSENKNELARKLGLGAVIALGVGTTVGSGIFSSLSEKLSLAQSLRKPFYKATVINILLFKHMFLQTDVLIISEDDNFSKQIFEKINLPTILSVSLFEIFYFPSE